VKSQIHSTENIMIGSYLQTFIVLQRFLVSEWRINMRFK